jgi:hypothetical protein
MESGRAANSVCGGLAGAVGGRIGVAVVARDRGDVDDPAAKHEVDRAMADELIGAAVAASMTA